MRSRTPRWPIWFLSLAFGLCSCGASFAQSADRDQLLRLVPADCGLCLVVQDLRGQTDRLAKAPWFQALARLPLAKSLAFSPEVKRILRFEAEFKKNLGFDFAQLQADILGNVMAFAYRPAPADKPNDEQGLFLLKAHDPVKLRQLIDRLNALQKDLGEITELANLEHHGLTYHRRVERNGTHYYFTQGDFLAYTNSESLLRTLIEQTRAPGTEAASNSLLRQLHKGGGDKALAALWLNPRAYDSDIQKKARAAGGAEGQVLRTFLTYWQAPDAVVLTLKLDAPLELALSVQVRGADLPEAARKLLLEPAEPAVIWKRLPGNALVALAGRVDALAWRTILEQFLPAGQGQPLADLHRSLGAALAMDPVRDVLPNLGPDWGMAIAPAADGAWPHALFALGVRPGSGEIGVDQALAKGLQFFVGLAVFEYNRTHADAFRVKSVVRDNVEIRYLVNDKVLPPGVQPAFALKDGYLLVASSPDAVSQFRLQDDDMPRGESPLLRFSPTETARFLNQHRHLASQLLCERHKISTEQADKWVNGVRDFLNIFARLTLVRRAEADRVSWVLRLYPSSESK